MDAMRRLLATLLAIMALVAAAGLPGGEARAQSACNYAASQGTTGPANWQTYCWLDMTSCNHTTATHTSGQNFTYTLSYGSTLTFSASGDIRCSNAATAPTSFASCTYTPSGAHDPAVRYICIKPKGSMAGSTGTPSSFTITFNSQIN